MNLLLDQDVYAITARYLRAQGHDVVRVVCYHVCGKRLKMVQQGVREGHKAKHGKNHCS